MSLTPDQQRLLAREIGLQIIQRLSLVPVPEEQARTFHWPKCLHCRRRPTMMVRPGVWLKVKTGIDSGYYASMTDGISLPESIIVPRYEILPCCSANYTKVVEHQTRKQKLRAQHGKDHTDR